MVVFFYLPILLFFAASFALGYLPLRCLGRLLTKGIALGNADILAALAGAAGTAAGFLVAGATGLDRFALAPDRVRDAWLNSGQAFVFELAQPVFSGAVCAIAVLLLHRISRPFLERSSILASVVGFLISLGDFLLWPVLFGPFVS